MKKICVAVMSRSNYGRLKSVIKAIKECPDLELQLIYGCSFYNAHNEFEPDFRIQAQLSGDDTEAMALTTGLLLIKITDTLKTLKPDIVFVHGDRFEVLACAIAAAYMNIPLAHTEGGEDTGTIDDKVRYAISALADIHFPVTDKAAKRLLGIAKNPKDIYVVGSTALDSIANIDLASDKKDYVVILHHPNTTDPEDITPLIETVECIPCNKVWVNPNVDAGSKAMLKAIHKQSVEFVKDLQPEEYARLIYNSKCLIGNTSSGIKEGAFLGVPYVCVGRRQEQREHGDNVIFVDYNRDDILSAVFWQMGQRYQRDYRFGDGHSAKKIVEVLACTY